MTVDAPTNHAPTLTRSDWLPTDSPFPWLNELGSTHRRILDARSAASSSRADLDRRFKHEDDARRTALTLGFRDPEAASSPSSPSTSPPERTGLIRDADDTLRAANDALDQFISHAIAQLEAHISPALDELSSSREDAAAKRLQASQLLAEAVAAETRVARLEEWLTRNAGTHRNPAFRDSDMRFFPFALMDQFTPPPPPSDGPQLVDPPSLPPWDAERAATRRAFELAQREGQPSTLGEALRDAIEEAPDPHAARVRTAEIAELARRFDNHNEGG